MTASSRPRARDHQAAAGRLHRAAAVPGQAMDRAVRAPSPRRDPGRA